MNRRLIIIALVLGGSFLFVWGLWGAQAYEMKREFMRVMLGEGVEHAPLLLENKRWTESELRAARVIRVPRSAGKEQALVRRAHIRDAGIIPNRRYSFEAIVTDSATGIKHVYGRLRSRGVWVYDNVHPDSAELYIQQRDELIQQYLKE